eukprot:TRINITY_DN11302_c0_g1_i1.p1 TRINITY_DN11302_c0_g1~~TRINITY_DN11302_c0_g1_i1.p1  ORF type:complete len:550 (-),score=127.11 TRINITY_DN11302_c0_g1_i1:40-1689(-)
MIDGTEFLARSIKQSGIHVAFGIVGVPVTPLVECMQQQGIKFYAMRNEQAASYAASVYGYLTGTPALCVTVAGPGLVHALPGLLNATANCWPMVLISSGPPSQHNFKGAFQEAPQLEAAKIYSKHAVRVNSLSSFNFHFNMALREATYGKPGGVYVEIAREVIESQIDASSVPELLPISPPPRSQAHQDEIRAALEHLTKAARPLLVFGKGAAYSFAEKELTSFVDELKIPFLASPMGKGVVADSHPYCVSAARSLALAKADVVLLVGVRMNWMFQFGKVFNAEAKIIQIDINPETFHQNINAHVSLLGDAKEVTSQLLAEYVANKETFVKEDTAAWLKQLREKAEGNAKLLEPKFAPSDPMNYHFVLNTIQQALPADAVVVNEGANTMDIGRLIFTHDQPRCRLDAGTLGTMGVGAGYAIAAAVAHPTRKVVTVQGDSAFGFSGMEVEVACRYQLPITFIVLNNNGIYRGVSEIDTTDPTKVPATVLTPDIHYEKIIEAFGGVGFYCESAETLKETVEKAVNCPSPCILNIKITPFGPIPAIVAGNKH